MQGHLRKYLAKPHQIFVQVACGHGSVLLWQHCNALFTYGFVDDVMISCSDPMALHVYAYNLTMVLTIPKVVVEL